MRNEFPVVGSYAKKFPLAFDPQDTLNMYTDYTDDQKSNGALIYTPGLNLDNGLKIATSGGIRKLYTSKLTPYLHAFVGENIYFIDTALNYSFGYGMSSYTGYVGIDETLDQLLAVDGVKGYLIVKNPVAYSVVTSGAFPTLPIDVASFGGRFYVMQSDTGDIYFSGVNDGTTWNTLNKFSITSYPDKNVALRTLNGMLFVFGTRCVEIWVLQGGYFPVARNESLFIEYGCASAGSISIENGVMIWLAYDKQGVTSVVATKGGVPERVSSIEIERLFQDYTDVSDASAFMYWENGILFYQLNFTSENASFLFNLNTKEWSRLAYKDNDRHLGNTISFFNGKKYIGDYTNPYIYDFSSNYYSDNGTAIRRQRVTSVFYPNNGEPFICQQLRFVFQQGTSNETGKDIDSQMIIRISRDNGQTFGNHLNIELGKLGSTMFHSEIYKLGLFEYGSIVIEFEFYNFTKFNVLKAFIDIE